MMKLHKLIASVFGIGYIKGGGTIASIACCAVWMILPADYLTDGLQVFYFIAVCGIGVWSSNVVEADWGKDSSKVVIDEVAGMMLTVLWFPFNWKTMVSGLLLFRFFDIVKPLGVRRIERLPGGWGVMGDDILAGLYGHLMLYFLFIIHLVG